VIAGITWIGHLYFFNFVNVPFQGALEADYKKFVNPKLLPRALWWFRWAAMITFLSGLILFYFNYMSWGYLYKDQGNKPGVSDRALWIMIGMTLGTIMWFNVWFIIWPLQRKIIGWIRDGQKPPEMPVYAKRALLTSRLNTYLSGPMLVCMLAAAVGGYQVFSITGLIFYAAISDLGIFLAIKSSAKVGTTV
jgi:uncharacterized membrane protein